MRSINPIHTDAWQALQQHYHEIKSIHLRDLFAANQQRFTQFSGHIADHLLLDYSKNRVTEQTLEKLLALAQQTGLPSAIQAMFNGEKINQTEQRAVLHIALRNRLNTPIQVDNQDVMPQVNAVLAKMKTFCQQVISGTWRGYTGLAITDVVNIGIGGSHLGPLMVTEALTPYKNHLKLHFVANMDASEITDTLQQLNPATTLFLIASKTFTTQETLTNAHSAKAWFLAVGGDAAKLQQHFIALSANAQAVTAFGINTHNRFDCWDWVGGRYSLWSAMGLSIALAIGFDQFEQLLSGAHAMDCHFAKTPLRQNLPVILALLSFWYSHFFGAQSEAILPYDHYLQQFTAYLQQLNMESNGKSIDRNGLPVNYPTGPIVWGAQGTNGQHAFHQQLHQGTQLIPCDFIGCVNSHNPLGQHHSQLMAHLLAQSQALAFGHTPIKETTHSLHSTAHSDRLGFKQLSGNRPSNTILLRKLTPYRLGLLLALYEHKVFSQGVLLNIFSFDQWGVELGKRLADQLLPDLATQKLITHYDSATNGLINCFKTWREP